MENPPKEIADVVRSITEPYDSKVILRNVENYFTQDARLEHPLMNQPYDSQNGREDLKGIYKMLRVTTLNNKIVFHAIMFNEDFTKATLELTMHIQFRHLPLKSQARYLVRLDLRKEADNKYRIYRQQDNFPTDITNSEAPVPPGVRLVNDVYKSIVGFCAARLGRFFTSVGWFGP